MNTEHLLHGKTIDADVAELRGRFPRTQDLYREVCVLLFFRHGTTPTANKLYQLVRKGSMSAPTEALSHFWSTLRERSRVTVEHADLPDELRAAAGDLVASLWKSAQSLSRAATSEIRTEAAAAVDVAKAGETLAQEAHAVVLNELDHTYAQVQKLESLTGQLREELAVAAATKTALEARLKEQRDQIIDIQSRLDRAREEQSGERKKLAERTQLAEYRFADMEKRALVEIDRERTLSAKLQKILDAERNVHTAANERIRDDHNVAQLAVGALREQIGSLQTSVNALREERDRKQAELQTTRSHLEAAIGQAAADGARAEQFHNELERLRSTSARPKASPKRTTKPAAVRKPRTRVSIPTED